MNTHVAFRVDFPYVGLMSDIESDLVMNAVDAKCEELGFEALTEIERVVTIMSEARYRFDLGGLPGFFSNATSDEVNRTLWALEQIGAAGTAKALRTAALQRPQADMNAFDIQFDEARSRDKMDDLLDNFIVRHAHDGIVFEEVRRAGVEYL